jgi:hypothetical protein
VTEPDEAAVKPRLYLPASAPVQSSANVGQLELTLHDVLCALHCHAPFSTAHFSAARAAASHEPFVTPQKKRRLHVSVPHESAAPLLHHASHSADVATLGAGRIAVTPPWLAQTFEQNESLDPTEHVPWRQMVAVSCVSPSAHTH